MVRIQPAPCVDGDRNLRDRTFSLYFRNVGLELHDREKPFSKPEPVETPDGFVMTFSVDDAARLLEDIARTLESMGVRVPSAAGEIKRMEAHLADMRRLAFLHFPIDGGSNG